jgi:hypothetical protein
VSARPTRAGAAGRPGGAPKAPLQANVTYRKVSLQ